MTPKRKTVRVRIAVGVDPRGHWHAYGDDEESDAEMYEDATWDGATIHWVEADVPIPEPPPDETVIEGTVEPVKPKRKVNR